MAKPIKKFRAGAIDASVWKNQVERDGKEFDAYNFSIERSCTDKDGKWKTTSSFKINDLPKVALVANKAYEFLSMKADSNGSDEIE